MSEIDVFQFNTTKVRVSIDPDTGDPLFILNDVCAAMDIVNTRNVASRLDPDDVRSADVIDSLGRVQRANAVTESGVYNVVLLSRKAEAMNFKRWLTREVLPQIRKTGSYSTSAPQNYIQALRALADAEEAKEMANQQRLALEPLAETAQRLLESKGAITVADTAKVLTRAGVATGQNRLFRTMGEMGWIFRRDNDWHPYQEAIERGYLIVTPRMHTHPKTGETVLDAPKITVTAKGLQGLEKALVTSKEIA